MDRADPSHHGVRGAGPNVLLPLVAGRDAQGCEAISRNLLKFLLSGEVSQHFLNFFFWPILDLAGRGVASWA